MIQLHQARTRIGSNCRRLLLAALVLGSSALTGCAALTNPVADGLPVRRVPPELLGRRRDELKTIPLSTLRQKPSDSYILNAGDILGVWVEGVLGAEKAPPPVQLAERADLPPSIGFPIPIREDGTVTVPLIAPVPVKGVTVDAAQTAITDAYVNAGILQRDRARVIVSLLKKRTYHVLVIRQDSGGVQISNGGGGGGQGGLGGTSFLGGSKRGTGYTLELAAGDNDVLNALSQTGGLPGLEAYNEILIERGAYRGQDPQTLTPPGSSPGGRGLTGGPQGLAQVTRIPLRLRPGEPLPFRPDDVILNKGDIVFIEARDAEVFYTGGLLGSRQLLLPRDYDLNVLEALALAGAPLFNGGIQQSNLSGNTLQSGIGFPSPTLVTVVRKTPGNGQVAIRIDLQRAMRDPSERILIQPGDFLLLQQTPAEAIVQYLTTQFQFNFLGEIFRGRSGVGTATFQGP